MAYDDYLYGGGYGGNARQPVSLGGQMFVPPGYQPYYGPQQYPFQALSGAAQGANQNIASVNAMNAATLANARDDATKLALQQLMNQGQLNNINAQGQWSLPGYQYGMDSAAQQNAAQMALAKEQAAANLGLAQLNSGTQMGLSRQGGLNDLGLAQQGGINNLLGLQQSGLNNVGAIQARNAGLLGFGQMLFGGGGLGGFMNPFFNSLQGVQGNTGQSAYLPGAAASPQYRMTDAGQQQVQNWWSPGSGNPWMQQMPAHQPTGMMYGSGVAGMRPAPTRPYQPPAVNSYQRFTPARFNQSALAGAY